MTKQEAVKLASTGVQVQHRLQRPTEWFYIDDNGVYRADDGTKWSESQYWSKKQHPLYNDGWSPYNNSLLIELRIQRLFNESLSLHGGRT